MRMTIDKSLCCFIILLCAACAGHKTTLAPVKTFDPDNQDIPKPKNIREEWYWDRTNMTFLYPIQKTLDLNWTARKAGKIFGGSERQADNINALDEAPNSSWYTNRNFHNPMTLDQLAAGPSTENDGPDNSGTLTIVSGKFTGASQGFTIKDITGKRFIIKFDNPQYWEMGSAAEIISTKILYAAGYNVPKNTVGFIDPDNLKIAEGTQVLDKGRKRPMTMQDIHKILEGRPRTPDGKIRCTASQYVDGIPHGVFYWHGRRSDDPNDKVNHEDRRELRGLRVIGSWINDTDRRIANTMCVYTENKNTGGKYLKHYLIDMGSTLGSNSGSPHRPKHGNEFLVDLRTIGLSFLGLGFYTKEWEFDGRKWQNPKYTALGTWRSDRFDGGHWYTSHPNAAFAAATLRDNYWGAKIVMSFSDEAIAAIVKEAKISDPEAETYMVKVLIERRDKVGRYYFSRINPLDKFRFEIDADKQIFFVFSDLTIDGGLESSEGTTYQWRILHKNNKMISSGASVIPAIIISQNWQGELDNFLSHEKFNTEEDKVFVVSIRTQRNGEISKKVDIHFYYPGGGIKPRVLRIEREE